MTIPTRRLGTSAICVSELGFGAAALGNLYQPVTDDDARATVDAALAAGLCYVDTAPFYGLGLSERRVGDALRETGHDVVLSSKVGRLLMPDASVRSDAERHGFRSAMPFAPVYDYSYDGVMRSWEASLQRLGLARIDILYVHDIGRRTHGDDRARTFAQLAGGGVRALEELRGGGAVGAFGIGVNEIDVCLHVMAEVRLDAILLAGRYTLLEQGALDALLPTCKAAGTSIVIGGPYNSGILATGTRAGTPHYDYAPAPPEVVARVAAIEAVAARHNVALAAAALQFPLAHPCVASVIPGLGHPGRVADTVALYDAHIATAFWRELQTEGLLRVDAPIPAETVDREP